MNVIAIRHDLHEGDHDRATHLQPADDGHASLQLTHTVSTGRDLEALLPPGDKGSVAMDTDVGGERKPPGVELSIMHVKMDMKADEKFSQWMTIGWVLGWQKASARAANEVTTFGVLSALLITICVPLFVSPPSFQGSDANPAISLSGIPTEHLVTLYGMSSFMALALSMLCTIECATVAVQLNLCTSDADVYLFFQNYGFVLVLNYAIFTGSVTLLCLAAFSILASRYSLHMLIGLSVSLGCMIGFAGLIAAWGYFGMSVVRLKSHFAHLKRSAAKKLKGHRGASVAPEPSGDDKC